MIRKVLNSYYASVFVLALCALCLVVYDCIRAAFVGSFTLFPELNLAKFQVGDAPFIDLQEAASYVQNMFADGYNRNDFVHVFMSLTVTICFVNVVMATITCLFDNTVISGKAKCFIVLAAIIALFLVVSLRLYMHDTYGNTEAEYLYPIAYLIIP